MPRPRPAVEVVVAAVRVPAVEPAAVAAAVWPLHCPSVARTAAVDRSDAAAAPD